MAKKKQKKGKYTSKTGRHYKTKKARSSAGCYWGKSQTKKKR